MRNRITRRFYQIIAGGFVFFTTILIRLTFYDKKNYCVNCDVPLGKSPKLTRQLLEFEQEYLESFSFAYNVTHLWSIRLPDDKYYRISRTVPCRTVDYTGGRPQIESFNSCDQNILNQFSIKAALKAQKWLYDHQHPVDCTNKKFAVIHQYALSGIGSTLHQILWAFGVALGENRIAVYQKPGNWLYGGCPSSNPDCFFLPISNCSIPTKIDGNQTRHITADFGHWTNPILPSIFRNQSYNWYRSQLMFYLMRFNPKTLAYVQDAISQHFKPASINSLRPYVAVYIRRTDKIMGREMARAYPLQEYFDLFDNDARRANINTVFINSEDQQAFKEFDSVNIKAQGYYKLLSINVTRNIIFSSLMSMEVEQRRKIILEFLTGLIIEVNADLHSGTLTSNWCRLVDEMRLAIGKTVPYYTPENRYIIDF